MAVEEIGDGSYGSIVVNNNPGGAFETSDGDDYWSWRSTWFPASGWSINFTTGSISNVDLTFTSYSFSTAAETPAPKFSGSTTFVIQKNGTTVGWLESLVTGNRAKLMWWSNGQSLNRNRKIDVSVGDTLSFTPGPLPTSKQYPLTNIQG